MTPEPNKPAQEQPEKPPSSASSKVLHRMMPIDRIADDQRFQVRGGIQASRVKEYEAIIREFGSMDPLDVFYIYEGDPPSKIPSDAKFNVADGFHRLEAYRACEVVSIPCAIKIGTETDALKAALKKNGHHGVPMNQAEKRHACDMAVVNPEIGNLPDVEIAKMIGCSPSLVGICRRGETKEQTTGKAKTRQRKAASAEQEPKPVPVSAHNRKAPNTPPTKAALLKQIDDWVSRDMIDEADVIGIFNSKDAAYAWTRTTGHYINLRVVGKSGREQVSVKVVLKSIGLEEIVFKSEEQKLQVAE